MRVKVNTHQCSDLIPQDLEIRNLTPQGLEIRGRDVGPDRQSHDLTRQICNLTPQGLEIRGRSVGLAHQGCNLAHQHRDLIPQIHDDIRGEFIFSKLCLWHSSAIVVGAAGTAEQRRREHGGRKNGYEILKSLIRKLLSDNSEM